MYWIQRIFFLFLAFAVLLLTCGCEKPQTQERVVPFVFLAETEKEDWKEDLVAFLATCHPKGQLVEIAPEEEDPDLRYDYIIGSYAIGLMDLDFDGLPEVIKAYAGGSAGNVEFVAFDMKTGENITSFEGSYENAWCAYYRYGTDDVHWIGHYRRRSGWSYSRQAITVLKKNGGVYEENPLFQMIHTYHLDEEYMIVPEAADYYVAGEKVEEETYYYDYMDFIETEIRIPETTVRLIAWHEVCEYDDAPLVYAEKMADALLSTEQAFAVLP